MRFLLNVPNIEKIETSKPHPGALLRYFDHYKLTDINEIDCYKAQFKNAENDSDRVRILLGFYELLTSYFMKAIGEIPPIRLTTKKDPLKDQWHYLKRKHVVTHAAASVF